MTHRVVALVVAALLLLPALAAPQGPGAFTYATFTTAVTLTTTTEAVVISSPRLNIPRDEAEVVVLCYAELTTGTNTTAVVARIRRGTSVSSPLVSEENEQNVKAAAGSIEPFVAMVSEQIRATAVQYSCTLDQVGASADGSAIYGGILVLAR